MQAMLALRIKKLLHDPRCEMWGILSQRSMPELRSNIREDSNIYSDGGIFQPSMVTVSS
jgi:hypothetical protein